MRTFFKHLVVHVLTILAFANYILIAVAPAVIIFQLLIAGVSYWQIRASKSDLVGGKKDVGSALDQGTNVTSAVITIIALILVVFSAIAFSTGSLTFNFGLEDIPGVGVFFLGGSLTTLPASNSLRILRRSQYKGAKIRDTSHLEEDAAENAEFETGPQSVGYQSTFDRVDPKDIARIKTFTL